MRKCLTGDLMNTKSRGSEAMELTYRELQVIKEALQILDRRIKEWQKVRDAVVKLAEHEKTIITKAGGGK